MFNKLSDFFPNLDIDHYLDYAFYSHRVKKDSMDHLVEDESESLNKTDKEDAKLLKGDIIKIFDTLDSEGQTKLWDFSLMLSKISDHTYKEE